MPGSGATGVVDAIGSGSRQGEIGDADAGCVICGRGAAASGEIAGEEGGGGGNGVMRTGAVSSESIGGESGVAVVGSVMSGTCLSGRWAPPTR